MGQHAISSELLQLGEDTIGCVARELASGAPAVHLQLFASRFYEELVEELQRTPPSNSEKADILAAATAQCRRLASFGLAPSSLVTELREVLATLSGAGSRAPQSPTSGRPQLRIIQGGLA